MQDEITNHLKNNAKFSSHGCLLSWSTVRRLRGSGCRHDCMKCRQAGVRGQLEGRRKVNLIIASSSEKASLEKRIKYRVAPSDQDVKGSALYFPDISASGGA